MAFQVSRVGVLDTLGLLTPPADLSPEPPKGRRFGERRKFVER